MNPPNHPPNPRGLPAFSLIEMITVIAILVMLLTAGLCLLNATGAHARRTATDLLAAMAEQARTTAITPRPYQTNG